MNCLNQLPDSLRVDDDTMAEAYETTGDVGRAWIKTTMALVRAVNGETPAQHDVRIQPAGTGFIIEKHSRPADVVLAVIQQGYTSGVRLAAAIMAARLAGVERVVALLVDAQQNERDGITPVPEILTALELLGVEEIFALPAAQLDELATAMLRERKKLPIGQKQPEMAQLPELSAIQQGRVLLFGAGTNPFSNLPVWQDAQQAVQPNSQQNVQQAVLENTAASPDNPCLQLHPDLAEAFVHIDLHPEFFAVSSVHIAPCNKPLP